MINTSGMQFILKHMLVFCFAGILISGHAQEETMRHLVQPLETYYSLSVKYHVSIDQIKAVNPGVRAPVTGQFINIPLISKEKKEFDNKDCIKSKKNRDITYEIALMIPLYLDQSLDSGWAESIDPSDVDDIAPFRFIQFYEGFMLAADSMTKQGMNLKVLVYDVDQQPEKLRIALADPELKNVELIIGPFLKNSFPSAANFALDHHIPIINPFSQRQDILTGNPYVFKIMPSPESQPETLAKLVKKNFSAYNVILYIPDKYQDVTLIDMIRSTLNNSISRDVPPVRVIDYATDSINGFLDFASMTQPNLIVVYSENEALPAALLSKLNSVKSDYTVTVIGIPEWDKFNNLESSYMLNLNGIILTSSYVDYEDDYVKGFIRRYRSDYLDEPQTYAITGFESGYFFMQALFNYGEDFIGCIDKLKIPLIQNQFYFLKQKGGGYDNIYWNVLQYEEFELVKMSIDW